MCQGKEHGGKRCAVTNRQRRMAATRRRIRRTATLLKEPNITRERKALLSERLLVARIELQEARDSKSDD